MHILIVDDDPVCRLVLASALQELGHDVTEADNGEEAWHAWRSNRHQLVISDWVMPGTDGLELCRRIRNTAANELIYFILLTARSGVSDYVTAMAAGADDFISKPVAKDQLVARVRVAERLLDMHVRLREANYDLDRRVQERTAELELALNAKGEFLSRASHELRTPMNHILGFAQLLEMDALTADQQESVDHILKSGHHLLTLIDRILAIAKSGSDEVHFLEAPVHHCTENHA